MLDFFIISTNTPKKDVIEIYPKFIVKKSNDLMIRGRDFYAVWVEQRGLWSTDEQDVIDLVDAELDDYAQKNKASFGEATVRVLHMWDSSTGIIERWHKYCQKHMRDNFKMLDSKMIFSNTPTRKDDYASHRLDYPLARGECPAFDKLIGTLYSPEERHKLEWAVGSIVTGDSRYLQKFLVLYGDPGAGKGTFINIVLRLFDGYCSVFDAKALGSASNQFALESFKDNPLVAVQHDGDLSRIEDNTRLNSLVSHEDMTVNEKYKGVYRNSFKCLLIMGTNKPVKITDAKSGLIRRLIDISPSGIKLPTDEYDKLKEQIPFELGAIAYKCREVYLTNPHFYDDYIPVAMIGASNDFFNYILDCWSLFTKENSTSLKTAWERYKLYCDDAKVSYPMSQRAFKEELKNYFSEYHERYVLNDGTRVRSFYKGFKSEKFEEKPEKKNVLCDIADNWLDFAERKSIFDEKCSDYIAQYANENGTPECKWSKVHTTLAQLDTSRLHYVKMPENHIVIDFDIPDETGEKSLELNKKAAARFPKTYGELSKSGRGIHLHYFYDGDPTKLEKIFDEHIEIKAFSGDASLRRMLSKCNDLDISTISSGLPLINRGGINVTDEKNIANEKGLRTLIKRNLAKEYHADTKSSINFITKALEDMYASGKPYDVSDMYNEIIAFAMNSTHNADYCVKAVSKMKFKSEQPSESVDVSTPTGDEPLIFYDIEVFPNLFLVNYKAQGEGKKVVRMINPSADSVSELVKHRLVGFNCRRYDNHILYARMMGYSVEELYKLSQNIINNGKGFFGEAYNLSYTDVYDFASTKQSLKKWEIQLGIHHQELGLPWNKPVPEEMWEKVAEYCDNDVLATEAVFDYKKVAADFSARQILADLAGGTVNDTTNSLTAKIIFGNNRTPQNEFIYRNLAEPIDISDGEVLGFLTETFPEMMSEKHGEAKSTLPYFEGYEYKNGKSAYCGEEVGEGGYVYAEPGIHYNVALLDIMSMHPHSAMAEVIFGPRFTKVFKELVYARVAIKHKDWDTASTMLDGRLAEYVTKIQNGEIKAKDLANALKIAINSVYGLTAANFTNAFRDIRNVDNIVAKRGALFMVNLKREVQKQGFTVAHIKTDSIKIPNATPEIIKFVYDYGKKFGYTFEHEATYDRMCLVNDAVYIAKYADDKACEQYYGYIPEKNGDFPNQWTATGTQFQVPYVFKTLFSKEEIIFDDLCETKSSATAIYLDLNEGLPNVEEEENVKLIRKRTTDQLSKREIDILNKWSNVSDEELDERISKGHNYRFVGKVGRFCPVKDGVGGGVLVWEKDGKYNSVSGTKGYRWLESEMVEQLGKQNDIRADYYETLVKKSAGAVSQYGDFDKFINGEQHEPSDTCVFKEFGVPPEACGKAYCTGCPNLIDQNFDMTCKLGYDIFPF